jgi:peroxiredoxin
MSKNRIIIGAVLVVLSSLTLIFSAQLTASKRLGLREHISTHSELNSTPHPPLPPYRMASVDQREISDDVLSRGRVLLVFLTTSCEPCLEEAKIISRLHQFNSTHLRIYGVSFERPAQVASFIKELDLKFPMLIDVNAQLTHGLEIHYFPSLYLVEEGRITQVWRGVTRDETALYHQLNVL